MEEVDSCPWCDCEDTCLCAYPENDKILFYGYCPNCEMNGPYEEIEDNAAIAWNFLKRAVVEWNKVKDGGNCGE